MPTSIEKLNELYEKINLANEEISSLESSLVPINKNFMDPNPSGCGSNRLWPFYINGRTCSSISDQINNTNLKINQLKNDIISYNNQINVLKQDPVVNDYVADQNQIRKNIKYVVIAAIIISVLGISIWAYKKYIAK